MKKLCTFENLVAGDYTAGVQRVYNSGVSEIVTKDFTIVEIIDVTGVSFSESAVNIKIDSTFQLTATVEPADATNKNVTWKSCADSVATVDATGLVTGVAAGTAQIVVTTEDGNFTDTCVVTVEENSVAVTDVSIDGAVDTLFVSETTHETVQLTANLQPADATNQNVSWASSDDSVATVDNNGLVTAVAAGNVSITVTTEDGGHTASCEIVVASTIGINSVFATDLVIYPNPAIDILHIDIADKNFTVKLYNLNGQQILQSQNKRDLSVTDLPSGIYMLQIITEEGVYNQKIVKK